MSLRVDAQSRRHGICTHGPILVSFICTRFEGQIKILSRAFRKTVYRFVTSCQRKGFALRASSETSIMEAEDVQCYGIASVFTHIQERGKGYAKHMMRLLHWAIAPHALLPPFPEVWGAPPNSVGNARFSVLYSDVGENFYLQCSPGDDRDKGWVVRGAIGICCR